MLFRASTALSTTINHLGVPSTDLVFDGPYGVYHSVYDTYGWMASQGDPGFRYHAGMARYAGLVDLDDESWDWHFDIVLRHAWLAMQLGAKRMAATGGGSMVFVASVSGITAAPLHAAYGAAKAGLMALVKSAAVELGPSNIRVNAVAPGVVWTPRVSGYLGDEGRARNSENAPLRRVALPEDIASALLFLASDLAGYVTGQTLVVDGGVGAKFPYPMPQ